jgi:hypothetical protein
MHKFTRGRVHRRAQVPFVHGIPALMLNSNVAAVMCCALIECEHLRTAGGKKQHHPQSQARRQRTACCHRHRQVSEALQQGVCSSAKRRTSSKLPLQIVCVFVHFGTQQADAHLLKRPITGRSVHVLQPGPVLVLHIEEVHDGTAAWQLLQSPPAPLQLHKWLAVGIIAPAVHPLRLQACREKRSQLSAGPASQPGTGH